jgi:hypothetical protein
MPTLRAIVRGVERDRNQFSAIVLGIVGSSQFQMRVKTAT